MKGSMSILVCFVAVVAGLIGIKMVEMPGMAKAAIVIAMLVAIVYVLMTQTRKKTEDTTPPDGNP
jgi:hypothetical protein